MTVQTNLMTVPARLLQSPLIRYTLRQQDNLADTAATETRDMEVTDGKWHLTGLSFNRYTKLVNPQGGQAWQGLALGEFDQGWSTDIERQLENFKAELEGLGVKVGERGDTEFLDTRRDFAANLLTRLNAIKSRGMQLVVVILPWDRDVGLYKTIKQTADVRVGIHNVVVRSQDKKGNGFMAANIEYHANIGQKLSLKLGGWNQTIENLGIVNDGRTMLMGLDVTVEYISLSTFRLANSCI